MKAGDGAADAPGDSDGVSPSEWESIVEELPFGLIVLGPGQELRFENAMCHRMLGIGVADAGGVADWLASLCPDEEHREKVIESWRENVWRNQVTSAFTLKSLDQRVKEIEFRSSLLSDGGMTLVLEDVTDVRRAEETRRDSHLKFRALFSHVDNGVVLVDRTGRILNANPAFLRFVGMKASELRLSTLHELLHPGDAEELATAEASLLSVDGRDESVTRDVRLRTRTSEKTTRIIYCPIGDAPESPTLGLYLLTPDEDESSDDGMADRMRRVAVKAQALLDTVPDLILLIDSELTIVDYAPPRHEWSEIDPTESWRGRSATAAWPVLGELLQRARDRVLVEEKTVHADLRGNGSEPFEFAVTLAACGDNQMLAVIRNRSEERRLRERQACLDTAAAGISETLLMMDAHGNVLEANDAAAEFFGADEIAGSHLTRWFGGDQQPLVQAFATALDELRPEVCRVAVRTAAGADIPAETRFLPVPRDDGKPFVLALIEALPSDGDATGDRADHTADDDTADGESPATEPPAGALDRERGQHRFRNQLQLVTSLFSLEPSGAAARDAFLKWQIRLRATARACPDDPDAPVPVVSLLHAIADEVASLTGHGPGRREVIVTGPEELAVDATDATPLSVLVGEWMRLVMGNRQPGPGPELHFDVGREPDGRIGIHVRPGEKRRFFFSDEETETEIFEILAAQMRGTIERSESGSGEAWEIRVPPVNRTGVR